MKKIATFFSALLLALILSACAGTGQPQTLEEKLADMGYRLGEPIERIYEYRVNGWNYLDRRHVILRSGVSDRYLITLQNDCHGLMSNEIIAYTTTVNQLTVFDKLLVRDGMSVLEQCWIRSLHKLQPTQA